MMREIIQKIKNWFTPIRAIGILSILFFTLTVLQPIFQMAKYTFVWSFDNLRMDPGSVEGQFTLFHWLRVFSSAVSSNLFFEPFLHSLYISAAVTILAFLLGGTTAWLMTCSDLPYKKVFSFLIIIPYIIPSWIKSFAWLIMFNRSEYGGQGLLPFLLGTDLPQWLSYGFFPIVVILTDHYYIYFFLLMTAAFNSIGGNLEEAAQVIGARRFTVLRKVSLPLILPAILSGMILIFLGSFDNYSVSSRLGVPVKYYTAGTSIYNAMGNRFFPDAYILSLILIFVSMLLIFCNQLLLRKSKRFETVGGKASRRQMVPLKGWKYPAVALLTILFLCGGVFPLALQVLQSLITKVGNYDFSNLTLHYWIGQSDPMYAKGEVGILVNPNTWSAIRNSILISLTAAVLCALIGLLMGYAVAKGRKSPLSKTVEHVALIPYLIPGISLGAIYISIFSKSHGPVPVLYGTVALLIIIVVVKKMPYSFRSSASIVYRIGDELEEAAIINGASFFKRFVRIILPLSRQGLMDIFMVIFIGAMKEMDLIVLLVTPKTQTLATLTFDYADRNSSQLSNALVVIMVVLILTVYSLTRRFGMAELSKGAGE